MKSMTNKRFRVARGLPALLTMLTYCAEAPEAPEPWQVAARNAQQVYRGQQWEQAEAGYREALQLAEEAESEAGFRGLKWCWPCSWFSPDSLGWPRPCSHRVQ